VRTEIRNLLERCARLHGRVDVLINAAGTTSTTPFLDISDEKWSESSPSTSSLVMRSCQEFGRYFVARAQSSGEGRASSTLAALRDLTPLSRVFTLLDDQKQPCTT